MIKANLAILICTIPERKGFLERLRIILSNQNAWFLTYIDDTVGISIGDKRNRLLQAAAESAEYVAFIDDDDLVSDNYVALLMEGMDKGADCCSLRGVITDDGKNPRMFEHSIKHQAYETISDPSGYAAIKYLRYPNHLNCIKSDIAKQFRFPEKNHGEDTDWATQIHNSGLLKTEYWIEDIIYYYEWRSKK